MKEAGARLLTTKTIEDARGLIDQALREVRDETSLKDRRELLRTLVLGGLSETLNVAAGIDHLLNAMPTEEWEVQFGPAVEKELPGLLVDVVDSMADVPHVDVLRLIPPEAHKTWVACIKKLSGYIDDVDEEHRRLRGMRASMIFADLFAQLNDPKIWRRRTVTPCSIDNKQI
ncbi:MAG: hypothetical protein QF689_03000, partial [Candidatus Latescibacteria bacterium]|nr:hypothetical protein [Candidatus Latescibacterota bacterium]